MNISFHGHSCIQIEEGDISLIIDPFLQGNPVATVSPQEIKVNYVLLTHGHNDHVGDTEQIAKQNDATVIAPFELATYLGWQGCKVHPMHIGGAHQFEFGRVKLTQAFHGSSRTDNENRTITYLGMPAGILLTINDQTIYHAGDTALFSDMKLIGELNEIDVAFLPIGDNFTMGPEDATLAAQWVKAKKVVPVHFNTFPLLEQKGEEYIQKLKEKGISGQIMNVGDVLEV